MKKRLVASVSGLVQGVFFRDFVKSAADRVGVSGFAKNERDGTVTVVAEGEEEGVRAVLDACKTGSAGARVDAVSETWESPRGESSGFRIM